MRRGELYDSSSETESNSQNGAEDVELRARLNERLSKLLGLDLSAPEPVTGQKTESDDVQRHGGVEEHEEKHEEEFEFRLFSTSSKTAAPPKVILSVSDDEDGAQVDGEFLVPMRPVTYYMAKPTPEQRERYRQVAVSGGDIVAGARKRAWGLERPWKVVKITVSAGRPSKATSSVVNSAVTGDQGDEGTKKRPGKKRRIAMRIKAKAEKARREAQEDQKMSKEEHLREKKKRLNREKKLKRRAKEKQQRLAAKVNGEAVSATGSDTDESAE